MRFLPKFPLFFIFYKLNTFTTLIFSLLNKLIEAKFNFLLELCARKKSDYDPMNWPTLLINLKNFDKPGHDNHFPKMNFLTFFSTLHILFLANTICVRLNTRLFCVSCSHRTTNTSTIP